MMSFNMTFQSYFLSCSIFITRISTTKCVSSKRTLFDFVDVDNLLNLQYLFLIELFVLNSFMSGF